MIENIITTEKRDKNTIKLTESDLKNIVKKVNGKINLQEVGEEAASKGTAYASKGSVVKKRIENMYGMKKLNDFIDYAKAADENTKGAAVLEIMGLIGLDPDRMSSFVAAAKTVGGKEKGAEKDVNLANLK